VPSVSWLAVSHVRGCALVPREELFLERDGVAENRRFVLVDADGRRLTLSRAGALARVTTEYDPETERLALHLPGGSEVAGHVELDGAVDVEFFGPRTVHGNVVRGAWADALSQYLGTDVRLVHIGRGAAHTHDSVASLISNASVAALGADVDARRFRIMIGLDGCRAHEEEEWLGTTIRAGEATLRVSWPIPRCVATKRNPDSGEIDLDTLSALQAYRGSVDLGVAAEVIEPGRIRVGDVVEANI
jgi:uncharacterized protein YcbX